MGDQHNMLAGMLGCDVGQRISNTIARLQGGFAPRRRPVGVALPPALRLLGPLCFYFCVGLTFKAAKGAFAQARVKLNGFVVYA